ncbi:hypothetical protein NQ314_003198 [Rhamnusium bicolor]|uniref:Uncharacterized protein n=1 Tax=Rhamnusium bicolor TaxID=1586634 RepID=A0AAV8ZPV8_9CUCU|nr:hypothetical protein NQ314_003198 [Rhamnusium bicolor]
MTISTKKSPQGTKPPKPARNMEVLELYSPLKVGKIVATSTKKKIDVFDSFRPNMGECLNYNISETCMKLDVGPTKINVKETKATYTPLPPDMMMPVKSRKHIGGFSHGGPPLDKYADDVWKEKQIILQERYRKELEQFIIRRKRRDRLEGTYHLSASIFIKYEKSGF